jgi:sugar transferase EpsL
MNRFCRSNDLHPRPKQLRDIVKRTMDIAVAFMGMLLLSPLFLYAALQVPWRRGSTIIFRQRRPGLHGEPFLIYKFRTMSDEKGPDGKLLPDVERLTERGRFLRRTSLDELPELWNVLKGDMSLVGPRPLLMEYLDRYTPEQMRRHHVRPGITGLAQISGRNNLPWEHKFDLDVWYVDHWSLWLDVRILFRTIRKVIKKEGISAEGVATMTRFDQPRDKAS